MRKQVIVYGASLAVLIVFLKYIEYSYFLKSFSQEFYFGLIALAFLIIGIWAGIQWIKTKPSLTPIQWDESAKQKLDISDRELEVLLAMAEGLSNKQIAEKLFISENTIKTHAANLYAKLNVNRRTQALHTARKIGLID